MESSLKSSLLPAYRKLLSPLVRILFRNGVNFEEFADLARSVFIDVAVAESDLREVNEISAATGIDRAEIDRLTRLNDEEFDLGGNLARITRVLTGWHTDNDYTGPYGLPLELPFEHPTQPDFRGLAKRYASKTDARVLLAELTRVGVIKETDSEWYKVLTRTYLPKTDEPDSVERLGDVIGNFVETIDHNRLETDPAKKLFERIAVADNGVRQEDLQRFNDYVKVRAQLFLEEIDNWLSQLDPPEEPSGQKAKGVMTGLGIYHYVAQEEKNRAR